MPRRHRVKQGETLPEIARRYGFLNWRVLAEHPDNTTLFETRRAGMLYPGDEIVIPDRDDRADDADTEQRHDFVVPLKRRYLRLRLLDARNDPLQNYRCRLHLLDGTVTRHTDTDGILETELSLRQAFLRVELETPLDEPQASTRPFLPARQTWLRWLRIGDLDPPTELTGLHARLRNLGYYFGKLDAPMDQSTRLALYKFERDWIPTVADTHRNEMPAAPDERTMRALAEVHDHVVPTPLRYEGERPEELPAPIPSVHVKHYLVAPTPEPNDTAYNTIRLYPPPDLVVDAHMHIQSNNCAPLPLVWQLLPGQPKLRRRTSDWLGSTVGQLVLGQLAKIGCQRTDQIGSIASARNTHAYQNQKSFPSTNLDEARLTPMIALPMDMELAHVDGFIGEPIYHPVSTRTEREVARHVPDPMTGHGTVVTDWEPMAPAQPNLVNPETGVLPCGRARDRRP